MSDKPKKKPAPKCGAVLNDQSILRILKCTRGLGHPGQHEASAKMPDRTMARMKWYDMKASITDAD